MPFSNRYTHNCILVPNRIILENSKTKQLSMSTIQEVFSMEGNVITKKITSLSLGCSQYVEKLFKSKPDFLDYL